MAKFESAFDFGDKVEIDGHAELHGVVLGFNFADAEFPTVSVAWFANGVGYRDWFAEWRLKLISKRKIPGGSNVLSEAPERTYV